MDAPKKRRGRGEGTITQLGPDSWVGAIDLPAIGGKRRRKKFYGPTKRAVLEAMRAAQAQPASIVESSSLTLAQWLDLWLAAKRETVAPSTAVHYQLHTGKLQRIAAGIQLAKVTAEVVQQIYAALERDGQAAANRRKTATVLRAALAMAHQRGLVMSNPATAIPKPRHTTPEMRPMSRDEARRFLIASKSDRLYPLFALALDTGARQGELFALAWSDVDFDAGAVTITKTLEHLGTPRVKEAKTRASRRRVLIAPRTLAALRDHRKRHPGPQDGPVFTDSDGGYLRKWNVIDRHFKPILKRAKIAGNVRFHDLRHTTASLLLQAGVNIKVVSERLGHSSVRITLDTYSHTLPGMQEHAVHAISNLFRQEEE